MFYEDGSYTELRTIAPAEDTVTPRLQNVTSGSAIYTRQPEPVDFQILSVKIRDRHSGAFVDLEDPAESPTRPEFTTGGKTIWYKAGDTVTLLIEASTYGEIITEGTNYTREIEVRTGTTTMMGGDVVASVEFTGRTEEGGLLVEFESPDSDGEIPVRVDFVNSRNTNVVGSYVNTTAALGRFWTPEEASGRYAPGGPSENYIELQYEDGDMTSQSFEMKEDSETSSGTWTVGEVVVLSFDDPDKEDWILEIKSEDDGETIDRLERSGSSWDKN